MISSIQLHTENNILESLTNYTLLRLDVRPLDNHLPVVELSRVTSPGYKFHSYADPSAGRHQIDQNSVIRAAIQVLVHMAEQLEGPGVTVDPEKLHDKSPLTLQENLSMLNLKSLDALLKEVEVGTSYKQETMLNILLEALPQIKSRNSAVFVKDLVVSQRVKDENALLQMIRKLPFNVAEYSQELLKELEPLMQLSRSAYSQDVCHTGILSFATLVFKSFINGACTPDAFEEYVQTYFSGYAESSDYSDRMTYLQGLSNLQMERVTSYLAPVIAGTSSAVTSSPTIQHERFLAVWATMALAPTSPVEVNKLYWPILTDPTENLEMRIAAVTMLLLSEPTPRRMLALHWYVASTQDPYLQNFWHTTIKSVEKSTYPCYKQLSRLASYVAAISKPPTELRYWSSGNYLVDAWDTRRDSGAAIQTLLFAQPSTGLPAVLFMTLNGHSNGLITNQYSIYIKMTGVTSNFLGKLNKINAQSVKMEELATLLKEMKVEPRPPEKVHIELLLKYQMATVYTTYINQTTLDKWTSGDLMETMNSIIQAESHVNQQIVSYPLQVEVSLPTELGTPVFLSTVVSTVTSLRGNLTHSMANAEVARENDVHLRYSSLGLTFVTTYNPILSTKHSVEISQASTTYLPLNLRAAVNVNEKVFKLLWLSPAKDSAPGIAAHSRTLVKIEASPELPLDKTCPQCKPVIPVQGLHHGADVKNDYLFDCEAPPTLPNLIGQLLDSHQANFNMFPGLRPILIGLHAFVLTVAPRLGRCGAALLPVHKTPLRTDLELSLADFNLQDMTAKVLHGFTLKQNIENGEIISSQNGTTLFEVSNNKFKIAIKAFGQGPTEPKEWKMCAELQEQYLGGPEQELSRYPGPFELEAMASFGPSGPKVCPANGTMFKAHIKGDVKVTPDTHDVIRNFKITIHGKNLPESVQTGATRAASLLALADRAPWAGVAGASLAGRIAHRLSENPLTLEGDVQVTKFMTSLSLDGDTSPVNIEGDTGFAWLLDSRSQFQLLRDIGIYRECKITSESILTLHGVNNPHNVTAGCLGLALGDCSPNPRLALLYSLQGSSVEIRMYTGGNYASISPGTPPKVGVNGKPVDWKKRYRFPEEEAFYDFEVWGTDDSIRIDSGINGAVLAWQPSGVTILLPNTYMATACGACASASEHYEKCTI